MGYVDEQSQMWWLIANIGKYKFGANTMAWL